MRLVERDIELLKEIERWRVILGRQICVLLEFSGQRACDRRLRKLMDAEYLERKKVLYGIPSIYSLTKQGRTLVQAPRSASKIKVEQVVHDIAVVDTAIYLILNKNLKKHEILSEKELHSADGFSNRIHRPDFICKRNNKTMAVEVELSMKSKTRFEKNIADNFSQYDKQLWVVPSLENKIAKFLLARKDTYPNIGILDIARVTKKHTV